MNTILKQPIIWLTSGLLILLLTLLTGCGQDEAEVSQQVQELLNTRLELRKKIASEEMLRAKNNLCREINTLAFKEAKIGDEEQRVRYRFTAFAQRDKQIYSASRLHLPLPPEQLIKSFRDYHLSQPQTRNEVDRYRVRISKIYVNYLLDVGSMAASFEEVNTSPISGASPCTDAQIDQWMQIIAYKGDWKKPLMGLEQ